MARRILFLLHGVGQRAPDDATDKLAAVATGWSKGTVDLLGKLTKKYDSKSDVSLKPGPDGVRIVPLSYGEIILRELMSWDDFGSKDVAKAFDKRFPQMGPGRIGQLQGISRTDAPLFWTGAVDVLFYRLFFDRDIRAHLREQIAQALVSEGAGALPPCSFICHSLGTSVLHDTLAELLVAPEQFGGFANMDIQLYASISNVSKVLQSVANPHGSAVRPIGAAGDARVAAFVRQFLNVHHIADPIAHIGMFRPSWDPAQAFYRDVQIDQPKFVDVHGLVHYLEHPQVHIPILRAACGITIDAATEKKALQDFAKVKGDPCPEALNVLLADAKKVNTAWDNRGDATGPVEFAVAMVDAFKAFERARTACGAP
ncbi:MAG: hypothetical protein ABI877_02070 [Gemmatimonadaceae bacterium]